jgi:molybdate transport system ATP-binding protein
MSLCVDIEKKLGAFRLRAQFEAQDGTTALLGASGCGKSVTLKCIAGIMTPDCGRIVLGNRVLFDSEKKIDLPPQQRRVGYLFQQYALFPNMTVEQNILCGIRREHKAQKKELLAEKIRMFRLEGLEKKHPAQISGGQQQRVALARILSSEPEAVLLDEPFSALDSYLKWNLELELADLLALFGGPVLWVSHDLDECYRNCGSVCVMEDGKTGAVTGMDEMIRCPESVSAARLAGCKNFLAAVEKNGAVYLPEWGMALPVDAKGKTFTTLGIPDHAVALSDGGALRCTLCRVIPGVEQDILLLRPEHCGEDVPTLRVSAARGNSLRAGETVCVALDAEKLLLL